MSMAKGGGQSAFAPPRGWAGEARQTRLTGEMYGGKAARMGGKDGADAKAAQDR